jgi:DNA-binding transcriptional regulator YiaG
MRTKKTKEEPAVTPEEIDTRWPPDRIKTLRHDLKLTQKEFASKVGVHVVTVIRWEGGSFAPSGLALNNLEQLARTAR